MITGYTVTCTDGTNSNTVTTSDVTATLVALTPNSLYTCSVTASTSAGNGPASSLNITTATDSKR